MSGKLNLPSRAEISGIRSGNPVFSRIYRILPDPVTEPRTYRHMSGWQAAWCADSGVTHPAVLYQNVRSHLYIYC